MRPLSIIMHVLIWSLDVILAHQITAGSVRKLDTSQSKCKFWFNLSMWFSLTKWLPGVSENWTPLKQNNILLNYVESRFWPNTWCRRIGPLSCRAFCSDIDSLQWKCEFGVTWLGGSNPSLSSDGIAVYTRPPEAHGRDTLPQPPSRLPPLSRNFERHGWIFGDCFGDGVCWIRSNEWGCHECF